MKTPYYRRLHSRLDELKLRRYAMNFSRRPVTHSAIFDSIWAPSWLCQLEYIVHELGHISEIRRFGFYTGRTYDYPEIGEIPLGTYGHKLTQTIKDLPALFQGPNEIHAATVTWLVMRDLGVTKTNTGRRIRTRLLESMRVNVNANEEAPPPMPFTEWVADSEMRRAVRRRAVVECAAEVVQHITALRILDP